MRTQGHRSISPQMGRGALQDRASRRRGILLSAGLGLLAPGVGRLLHAGRWRPLRQPHAQTIGRQVDVPVFCNGNQRLALVRRRARIRQCAPSPGADPNGPDDPHATRTSRPACDRCVGSCRFRPRHRDASDRSGPRASAGSARNPKRSISSPSRRQQRFLPALLRGGRTAARSGRQGRCARSVGFWAKTTCRRH